MRSPPIDLSFPPVCTIHLSISSQIAFLRVFKAPVLYVYALAFYLATVRLSSSKISSLDFPFRWLMDFTTVLCLKVSHKEQWISCALDAIFIM